MAIMARTFSSHLVLPCPDFVPQSGDAWLLTPRFLRYGREIQWMIGTIIIKWLGICQKTWLQNDDLSCGASRNSTMIKKLQLQQKTWKIPFFLHEIGWWYGFHLPLLVHLRYGWAGRLGKVEELYQKWCKKGKPSGKPLGSMVEKLEAI